MFLFPTDILRFACVDVPVCVCRVQPEVDRKFPPFQREGRASSCQPEQPSYRVGRPLAAADDGGQRRKEKDYRLFSVHIQQIFDLLQLFPFFFFSFLAQLGLVFWLAGVGSFVSQLVRATDKKRKPPKNKIIYKNERKREPPSIEWKEPKEKINEID